MERKDLIDILRRVEPGLSVKGFIPAFKCFRFAGKTAMAYDDVIAVEFPCEDFPVEGCLPGALLLSMLGASKAKEVVIEQTEEAVNIKLGRSRLKLPVLPVKDFLFKPPSDKGLVQIDVTPDLLEGLRMAMVSAGTDPSQPKRLGVTTVFEASRIVLYSSDDVTMTRVVLSMTPPKELVDTVMILPTRFCEVVTQQPKEDPVIFLLLSGTIAQAMTQAGLWVCSRLVEGADPEQFSSVFKEFKVEEEGQFPIPAALENCIVRAGMLVDAGGGQYTDFSLEAGVLTVHTETPGGEVKDTIKLECDVPAASGKCSPKRVGRILPLVESMAIGRSLYFSAPNMTHLISFAI